MPKMLLGNILFITILGGWYFYTDGDRSLMLGGTLMAFGCFVSGIFMGYVLHTPSKRRAAPPEAATAHERLIETASGHISEADEGGDGAELAQESLVDANEEVDKPDAVEKVVEATPIQDDQPVATKESTLIPDKTPSGMDSVNSLNTQPVE
jgi:hypothetical protein